MKELKVWHWLSLTYKPSNIRKLYDRQQCEQISVFARDVLSVACALIALDRMPGSRLVENST